MTKAPRTILWRLGTALVCAAAVAGCQPTRKFQPKVEQDGKFLVHIVVSPKEEIGPLCSWYSGEPGCKELIAQANPGTDLSALQVGERILVPFGILRRVERYQAGATPPPLNVAPPPAASPTEAAVETSDPLEGDNFRDLPQTPPAAEERPSGDPLEQLMREQEESRKQPPQAPAAAGDQAAPGTPALDTFDLQDDAEAPASQPSHEEQPPAEASSAGAVGAAGAAAAPVPKTEPPPAAGQQIEDLRRELGLAQ